MANGCSKIFLLPLWLGRTLRCWGDDDPQPIGRRQGHRRGTPRPANLFMKYIWSTPGGIGVALIGLLIVGPTIHQIMNQRKQ